MTRSKLTLLYAGWSLIFIVFHNHLTAQFAPRIRTARPSATMGTYTVGKDVLQWQSGMRWQEVHADQVDRYTFQYKTTLRWGFAEHWEMSGVINYQRDRFTSSPDRQIYDGIRALRLGIRRHLFEKEGFLKAAAIQGRLWIPFADGAYRQEKPGGRIMASVSYRLLGRLQLITNGGWRWTGQPASSPISFFSLRFSYPLSKNLSLVADYFSKFEPFEPDYAIGIGYHITPLWKLDIAVGNLGEFRSSDRYLELGWTSRIDWRD